MDKKKKIIMYVIVSLIIAAVISFVLYTTLSDSSYLIHLNNESNSISENYSK